MTPFRELFGLQYVSDPTRIRIVDLRLNVGQNGIVVNFCSQPEYETTVPCISKLSLV